MHRPIDLPFNLSSTAFVCLFATIQLSSDAASYPLVTFFKCDRQRLAHCAANKVMAQNTLRTVVLTIFEGNRQMSRSEKV